MGRSPFFSIYSLPLDQVMPTSDHIKQLKVGDKIRLKLKAYNSSHIYRAISIYEYEPSHLSQDIIYEVTDVDHIPSFHEIGLNVISVISTSHQNPSNHMNGWYITTDGYIRECEHFGVMSIIESIEIM